LTICTLSTSCGTSSDVGQCKINCEMGSIYGNCYSPADVACVRNAASASSCSSLSACGWTL